jgi:hypothetical protein
VADRRDPTKPSSASPGEYVTVTTRSGAGSARTAARSLAGVLTPAL